MWPGPLTSAALVSLFERVFGTDDETTQMVQAELAL
jgi:hypothetical protein